MLRQLAAAVNDARFFHQAENYVSWIDLPTAESLTHAIGKVMVIVVPAFTKGNHSQPEIIAALILSLKSSATPFVSQRIYNKSTVIEQNRGQKKAVNKRLVTI